jgi:hypothetical protein
MTTPTQTEFNSYIGKPLEVLTGAAREAGKIVRVVFKDGKPLIVTSDHNVNRLNVSINNNIVTGINGFG